jgi:Raf kinase inhibitor-like YbhB/YbcL family protein
MSKGGGAMFKLTSSAFENGGVIPDKYVEDSVISPPLAWEGVPEGTESFALLMLDPDIPQQYRDNLGRDFIHWIACVPASVSSLPEGASPGNMPAGSVEFNTDFVTFGLPGYGQHYGGPWPPDAAHRYVFVLFALKAALDIPTSAGFDKIAESILYNTIDVASLTAVYGPAKKPLPGS